jgi:DeoR family transcriptional regulator of aga operon
VSAQHRLNRTLELVTDRGNVSIAEVAQALGVSTATVRRDLNLLAEQRLVTRTHGGAAVLGSGYELPLQYRIPRQAEAKLAIARTVAALVPPGAAVGLNGGTTTTEVARALGASDRHGSVGVTIVTNALNIAYELSVREHVKIVVTGGVPRSRSYELVGPLVAAGLADVNLDVAVLGVDGLTARSGATTVHEGEADASRHLAAAAARVVVAADATKLGRTTFARMLPLDRLDTLVTDGPVPADLAADLAGAGVEVVLAGAPPQGGTRAR